MDLLFGQRRNKRWRHCSDAACGARTDLRPRDLLLQPCAKSGPAAAPTTTGTPDPEEAAEGETQEAGEAVASAQAVPDASGTYSLGGRIVAYDKKTGNIVWSVEQTNDYWASPVVVYDAQGKAYLIQCDRKRHRHLLRCVQRHAAQHDRSRQPNRLDAPAVCSDNMVVVGTRARAAREKAHRSSASRSGNPYITKKFRFRSTSGRRCSFSIIELSRLKRNILFTWCKKYLTRVMNSVVYYM